MAREYSSKPWKVVTGTDHEERWQAYPGLKPELDDLAQFRNFVVPPIDRCFSTKLGSVRHRRVACQCQQLVEIVWYKVQNMETWQAKLGR